MGNEAITVLETLLQSEPENAAAKSMLLETKRSSQLSDRRAKKMSQRMLAVERDPRVPPTQREEFMNSLHSTYTDSLDYVRWVYRKCLDFPATIFSEMKRQSEVLLRPVLSRLERLRRLFGSKSQDDLKTD